jgi:hypothetical protein
MTTDIAYLDDLRTDLADVARRETILREAPALGGRPARRHSRAPAPRTTQRRPSRRLVLAVVAAAFIATAGVIGYFVTRDGGPFAPRSRIESAASGSRRAQGVAPRGSADFGPEGEIPAPAAEPGDASTGHSGAGASGVLPPQFAGTTPSSGPQPGDPTTPLVGPLIVKTADLSLVVQRGHFVDAFNRATAVAAPLGGFVSSSSSVGVQTHSGTLTIRVPSENFDKALAELRAIGRVEAQTVRGDDVTAQYVDLNARLTTWESQEQALLKLMGKATTVAETLRVQTELQRVQLIIEQLKGQIRLLRDQSSNATIAVSISEPAPKPKVSVTKVQNPSFGTGFRRALAGLLNVLVAVLVGIGYLIPIAALGALVWLVVTRVRRRRYATA